MLPQPSPHGLSPTLQSCHCPRKGSACRILLPSQRDLSEPVACFLSLAYPARQQESLGAGYGLPCHGKLLHCGSQPEKVIALKRVVLSSVGVAGNSAISPSDTSSLSVHLGTWACLWGNWERAMGKWNISQGAWHFLWRKRNWPRVCLIWSASTPQDLEWTFELPRPAISCHPEGKRSPGRLPDVSKVSCRCLAEPGLE